MVVYQHFYENVKQQKIFLTSIRNISANQHIRMTSEGSRDTEK